MKLLVVFVVGCFILSCGQGNVKEMDANALVDVTPADKSKLYIRFPAKEEIRFFGQIPVDEEDEQAASMLYPGYSAASFLVGIAVHAAAQSGANAEKKRARRKLANKVLEKYRGVLEQIDSQKVVDINRQYTVGETPVQVYHSSSRVDSSNVFIADVSPSFFLTQDEETLILVNQIVFSDASMSAKDIQPLNIEFVSSSWSESYLKENQFTNFYEKVRELFHASVELGLREHLGLMNTDAIKQQTIRYMEAGEKKIERGYLLESSCKRMVFKTLRGSIKSAPKLSDSCVTEGV